MNRSTSAMIRFSTTMSQYIRSKAMCCHIVFLFTLVATLAESAGAQQLRTPASDFIRHTVVQPIVHHGRTKREINSTVDTTGDHVKEITVTLNVNGEEYVLNLQLNEALIGKDYIVRYQKDGKTVLEKPTKEELDLCQYSGTIHGKPGSWAAVSTCRGITGVIHDGTTIKYIEPARGNAISNIHFLYDYLETLYKRGIIRRVPNNAGFGHQLLEAQLNEGKLQQSMIGESNREAIIPSNERRYLELLLVADNKEFLASGESIENVHLMYRDIANILNSMFARLNISIILAGVDIWSEQDAIAISEDPSITLRSFVEYKNTALLPIIDIDYAHLITHQNFPQGVRGASVFSALCIDTFSGGISSRYSKVNGLVAAVIAHELGHNLGLKHDEPGCECPNAYCIMSGYNTNGFTPSDWSSCSLKWLSEWYQQGRDYCLRKRESTCGNGVEEDGEDCDCGPNGSAKCKACCHPRQCKSILSNSCFKYYNPSNSGIEIIRTMQAEGSIS